MQNCLCYSDHSQDVAYGRGNVYPSRDCHNYQFVPITAGQCACTVVQVLCKTSKCSLEQVTLPCSSVLRMYNLFECVAGIDSCNSFVQFSSSAVLYRCATKLNAVKCSEV